MILLSYDLACGTNTRYHGTRSLVVYLTISAFAENAEMVAMENYTDVGDTLGKPCHPLLWIYSQLFFLSFQWLLVKHEDEALQDFNLPYNNHEKSPEIISDLKDIQQVVMQTDEKDKKKQNSREKSRKYREKLKNNPERLRLYHQKDRERKKKARDLNKLVGKSAEQAARDQENSHRRVRKFRLKQKALKMLEEANNM